jgi:hypothetical protein
VVDALVSALNVPTTFLFFLIAQNEGKIQETIKRQGQ